MADLRDFQHRGAGTGKVGGKRFTLARFDPAAKPFSSGSKARDKAKVAALATRIDELQDLFYADRRFKLLVVLQGTDTAGKDGTIRGVFGQTSALGVHAVGWKAPTGDERAHDYLWRIHQKVPAEGEIVIFNRSHYEDVLVARARGQQDRQEQQRRLAQIADFERMLSEEGTTLIKCYLHISIDEQRRRLQERLDDPTKHWKFDYSDIREREYWDQYIAAYEDALAATSRPHAPWYVIPANHKWVRDLIVSAILVHTLHRLGMRYPPPPAGLAEVKLD